ncbi:tubulin-specific chaperone A [Drosophila busckii]|uniref:tubulin-specific chaperone A n=1 Tax=Drosophila busckii TaxID=30019 RepID=UPI00083ED0EA|nr:tubulin-specific chaperone A [Drosophila busckii]
MSGTTQSHRRCLEDAFGGQRTMDPRLDQLVVYSSVLEHLLQQKLHYERDRDLELLRLERFKCEGMQTARLRIQQRVVKRVQGMLPDIVFKLRNEHDRLEKFMQRESQLKLINESLYDKSSQLLHACKQNLKQTL